MKRIFTIILVMVIGSVGLLAMGDTGRTFKNFSGVCHGNIKLEQLWDTALGWDRFDLSWQNIEPEQGRWNQERLKKFADLRVLESRKRGVKFLPILDYTTPWAAGVVPDQDFVLGKVHYVIKRQDNGSYQMEMFNQIKQGNTVKEVKFAERNISAMRMSQRYLGEEHVKDWEEYVRKCVSFLRTEPYNVEYFQIWNEAHPTSSFWYGDMDTYFKRIHLPAAKIIRELGGKVVYGGWICGAPMSEFVELLDKHDAWKTIDIMDLHYFPLSSMEYLYRELEKRKVEYIGIWQTEIGFTTDPNFIGNFYPRMIYWGLTRNWDYGDKFKSFYFAHGSPDDPKAYGFRRSLHLGKELNNSGRSLDAMSKVFANGEIKLYNDVETTPKLKFELDERLSSMESFKVDNRIIASLHVLYNNNAKIFVDWNGDLDTIHIDYDNPLIKVNFPKVEIGKVLKVERVSMYGTTLDLTDRISTEKNKGFSIEVPIRELNSKEFEYTDMPESFLPQLFYVVVTLK